MWSIDIEQYTKPMQDSMDKIVERLDTVVELLTEIRDQSKTP